MNRAARLTFAWKIFLVTFVMLLSFSTLYSALYSGRQSVAQEAGTLGLVTGPRDAQWRFPIVALAPDSPLIQAGARAGDRFAFVRPADSWRALGTDETLDLMLYHDGKSRQISVRPVHATANATTSAAWTTYVINSLQTVCCLILGLLVGLRGAQDRATRALALILIVPAVSQLRIYLPGGLLHEVITLVVAPLSIWAMYAAFLYFCLQQPAQRPLIQRPAIRAVFSLLVGTLLLVYVWLIVQNLTRGRWGNLDPLGLLDLRGAPIVAIVLCGLAALGTAWQRSAGVARQRLAWVGLCLGTIFGTYAIYNASATLHLPLDRLNATALDAIQLSCNILLSYATLRYRLFDISFAINRTLVFSVTSAALILVFFLVERFVHQFLHFDSAEDSALVSGAIAFALFFAFNRLHHRVDHVVEKLLFHSWHENAAKLDVFVHKASHFTAAAQLLDAFGKELDRFTGQAGYALYRSNADSGKFERVHASLPDMPGTIDENDDVAVTLRSDRAPARLSEAAWQHPGELALPMLQGANLYGMAIVGAKPNGNLYRPDEIAALAFAITQVGLDLFALRVQQLEAEHRDMAHRADANEERLGAALREMESIRLALGATSRTGNLA